jgi:hypothetical protein
VLLDSCDERLRLLPFAEQLDRLLGLRADDAVDEHGAKSRPVNALASFRLHLLAGRRVLHLEGCVGTLFKNRADSSLGTT